MGKSGGFLEIKREEKKLTAENETKPIYQK